MSPSSVARRRRTDRGATAVEYGLTAVVGTMLGVGGLTLLQPVLSGVFEQTACDPSSGYYCEEP